MRGTGREWRTTESTTTKAEVAGNSVPLRKVGNKNGHLCEFRKCYVCIDIPGARVKFAFSDRVEAPKDVLVRFVENETVLLNLDTECYYGLDEIGTRMWQVLTAAESIEKAYDELLSEFEVEPDLLRRHLSNLVDRLAELGLLRVRNANVEGDPAI